MADRFHENSQIGEYRILDFLGAGGMGEVYRAVHSKLGRVVAIKVLTQHDSDFFKRFVNEARIQASLQHTNIATLYDFIESQGRPCIVMEFVDGETLSERILRQGGLSVPEFLSIMSAIVEAVGYIHQNGVVHRDIKSNNVKIDSRGKVKLLDFGIARSEWTPKLTATGSVIGTLQYLSPEQVKGAHADARCDVWALGVMSYEALAGKVPFEGTNTLNLYEKISKCSYVPLSSLKPSIPHEVELMITHCLKKSPADRYQSAEQMLHDVRLLCGRYTVPAAVAPKANGGGRSWKVMSRYWPLILAVAVAILILISVVVTIMRTPTSFTDKKTVPPTRTDEPFVEKKGAADFRAVTIDVPEGAAEVYRNGTLVGRTPYEIQARLGEQVSLQLKREGFVDTPVEFDVSANKGVYTFNMQKKR